MLCLCYPSWAETGLGWQQVPKPQRVPKPKGSIKIRIWVWGREMRVPRQPRLGARHPLRSRCGV